MTRLHMIVEGQTEEAYSNRVLVPHLSQSSVYPIVQLIAPRRRINSRLFKGGWNSYHKVKEHIIRWETNDRSDEVWFTTMLDLYALPADFPCLSEALTMSDAYARVAYLEEAFRADIAAVGITRFVPYLQLHEFEALLFTNARCLDWEFLEHERQIARLAKLAEGYESPELINMDPKTAPSKRIMAEIPEYGARKVSSGPLIADKIGLARLRERCPHFNAWLGKLEAL